jgi:hypothetical protein
VCVQILDHLIKRRTNGSIEDEECYILEPVSPQYLLRCHGGDDDDHHDDHDGRSAGKEDKMSIPKD